MAGYYSALIAKLMEEDRNDSAGRSHRVNLPGGCLLEKEASCDGRRCASCGFDRREDARRRRLPFWKNKKGLWQKRVGRSENLNDDRIRG